MSKAYSNCLYRNPRKMLPTGSDILDALSRGEPIEFGLYDINVGGGVTLASLSFTRTGAIVMEGVSGTQTIAADKIDPLHGNVLDAWRKFTKAARHEHTIRDLNYSGLTLTQAKQFAEAAEILIDAETRRDQAISVLTPITAAAGDALSKARLFSRMAEHLPPGIEYRGHLEALSAQARKSTTSV